MNRSQSLIYAWLKVHSSDSFLLSSFLVVFGHVLIVSFTPLSNSFEGNGNHQMRVFFSAAIIGPFTSGHGHTFYFVLSWHEHFFIAGFLGLNIYVIQAVVPRSHFEGAILVSIGPFLHIYRAKYLKNGWKHSNISRDVFNRNQTLYVSSGTIRTMPLE